MAPRPLRPKDEPGGADLNDSAADAKSTSKRRAVSSACIPCRKRKSKCDGNLPSCSTCVAVYRTECFYDGDNDHHRKSATKRDFQSLQMANDALDVMVASLRSLPEDEAITLLHSLRNEPDLNNIVGTLRTAGRLPVSHATHALEADLVHASQPPSTGSGQDLSTSNYASSREHSMDESSERSSQHGHSIWFRQAQDPDFVDHLLTLYFTWVHPFYQFFSRDAFLHDMNRGRTDFCSALLVNAIMSMACHYSDRPQARTDPNRPATAGNEFFAEAKRLLDSNDHSSLTTVQALGIMGIRECSQGREGNGYKYAGRCGRMALELGLHLSAIGNGMRASELEARKITFWGVFNVETICAMSFGRLSQLPRAAADIPKPTSNDRSESQSWRPYQDHAISHSPSSDQHMWPMLFVEHHSKLSELACDMVNTFYAPQERFTSRRLVAAYNMYQQWHRDLPDALRLQNSSLPHVLVLHMYYFSCVLHLFRPYIKLDLRAANLFPRDTCTFCANEISALMSALRAMYGLRRVCLAVTSLVLSASTIHLLNLPSEVAAMNLSQGMLDLSAMAVTHPFAGRCIEIIRSLAAKWNLTLPESASNAPIFQPLSPTAAGPSPLTTFFAATIPKIEQPDSGRQSNSTGSRESPSEISEGSQPHQPFNSFRNDLVDLTHSQNAFWTPFPSQGMPTPAPNLSNMVLDFQQQQQQQQQQPAWMMTDGQVNHRPDSGGPHDGSVPGTAPDMSSWNWQ